MSKLEGVQIFKVQEKKKIAKKKKSRTLKICTPPNFDTLISIFWVPEAENGIFVIFGGGSADGRKPFK